MSTVAERVARGAALLDRLRPGWRGEVDSERLDQSDGSACVLSQLYSGRYSAGLVATGLSTQEASVAVDHGFTLTSAEWRSGVSLDQSLTIAAELNSEWRRELARQLVQSRTVQAAAPRELSRDDAWALPPGAVYEVRYRTTKIDGALRVSDDDPAYWLISEPEPPVDPIEETAKTYAREQWGVRPWDTLPLGLQETARNKAAILIEAYENAREKMT